MSESNRKAIYSAVVAVSAVLVAYGVYDATIQNSILSLCQGILSLVPVVGGIIAHRHVSTPPSSDDGPQIPSE